MDKQNRRNINVLLYFVHKISEYTFLLFPKIIHKKSQLLSIFWSKIFKLSIFLFLINVSNKFWNYQFSILVNTISLLFFLIDGLQSCFFKFQTVCGFKTFPTIWLELSPAKTLKIMLQCATIKSCYTSKTKRQIFAGIHKKYQHLPGHYVGTG